MNRAIFGMMLLAAAVAARAGEAPESLQRLIQPEFDSISGNLGAALKLSGQETPSLLLTGSAIGNVFSQTRFRNEVIPGSREGISTLQPASYRFSLPGGFGVSGFRALLSDSSTTVTGVNVDYRLLEPRNNRPALDIGGNYGHVGGNPYYDASASGVNFTVSRPFGPITPYAGAGRSWITTGAGPHIDAGRESTSLNNLFVGAKLHLGYQNFTFHAHRSGHSVSVGARLGLKY